MSGFMPWDSVVDLIKDGIDKIWPDKTEAEKARAALEQAQLSGALQEMNAQWDNAKAQLTVNQQEAGSASLFVAGWRPFIGWVCGSAFAYTFVLQPVLVILTQPLMRAIRIIPSFASLLRVRSDTLTICAASSNVRRLTAPEQLLPWRSSFYTP